MKTIFITAESGVNVIPVLGKALKLLPEKVGLVTTAQHLGKLREARDFLEKNGKKAVIGGQVLGCNVMSAEKIADKVDCILFIGSGKFHPIGIGKVKKIIIANPFTNEVSEIGEIEIKKIEIKRKVAVSKFLGSDKIGVIMSTKKGQSANVDRKKLQKKYPNKKFFYFACDTLNMNDLENFPFIECWINTMCPRIAYEDYSQKAIVNLEDV
jgi:2-(3-amino-3-carboxypropyl)histidine synthase